MNFLDARLSARFWDKVSPCPTSGCWLWIASLDSVGYGKFRVGDRMAKAHRVSFEIARGPVPAGLELDHLCRVRVCVNPLHLEAVTHAENVRRGEGGANWGAKTSCPAGHPYSTENTYHHRGQRHCRECSRAAWRRWRSRNPKGAA